MTAQWVNQIDLAYSRFDESVIGILGNQKICWGPHRCVLQYLPFPPFVMVVMLITMAYDNACASLVYFGTTGNGSHYTDLMMMMMMIIMMMMMMIMMMMIVMMMMMIYHVTKLLLICHYAYEWHMWTQFARYEIWFLGHYRCTSITYAFVTRGSV